jgi:hypothetical protein
MSEYSQEKASEYGKKLSKGGKDTVNAAVYVKKP